MSLGLISHSMICYKNDTLCLDYSQLVMLAESSSVSDRHHVANLFILASIFIKQTMSFNCAVAITKQIRDVIITRKFTAYPSPKS